MHVCAFLLLTNHYISECKLWLISLSCFRKHKRTKNLKSESALKGIWPFSISFVTVSHNVTLHVTGIHGIYTKTRQYQIWRWGETYFLATFSLDSTRAVGLILAGLPFCADAQDKVPMPPVLITILLMLISA